MTQPAESKPMAAGICFGRYEVVSRLYSGDVSEIWTAIPIAGATSERAVALKTLRSHLASHPLYREQLAREIALHARVDHPSIVRCAGSSAPADSVDYLALEYVDGKTLRELLDSSGTRNDAGNIPIATALRWIAEICDALAYLHDLPGGRDPSGPRGVVHGDVCPENILIDSHHRVKLIDLGSASPPRGLARAPRPIVSRMSPRFGRLHYRAPERFERTGLEGRSDVYSVGVILYELTRGATSHAESMQEVLQRIGRGDVVDGAETIDSDVAALVANATRTNPAERIATARELGARALAAATRLECGRVVSLPTPATPATPAEDAPPDTLRPGAGTQLEQEVHELLRTMRENDERAVAAVASWIDDPAPNASEAARADPSPESPFDRTSSAPPPQSGRRASTPNVFAAHAAHSRRRHAPRVAPAMLVEAPLEARASDDDAKAAAREFERGWTALRAGSPAEALEAWESALALDPDNRVYALDVRQLRKKLLQQSAQSSARPIERPSDPPSGSRAKHLDVHAGSGAPRPPVAGHETRRST